MSLRAFHLFFISISALLCLGISYWAYRQDQGIYLVIGSLGFVGLIFYLRWFLEKQKVRA